MRRVTPAFDIETIQNTPIYAITDISNNRSFGASIVGYMAFGGTMKVGRFATTYVTGSHAFKTGVEYGVGHGPNGARNWYTGDVTMNFNNGAPQQVTLRIPRDQDDGYGDLQMFVQDRWTLGRATITGGLRYDYFVGYVNDSTLPASRWNAAQFFPGFELQHWQDISPRGGISYDLFGNGKTALKMSVARYVAPESNGTAAGQQPADDDRADRHAELERSERRLHDLQPGRLGSVCRARADEQRQLRQEHSEHRDAGSADAQRLGRAGFDDRMAGDGAARADAARRPGGRLLPEGRRQPDWRSTTRWSPTPTTRDRSASPHRPTPTCRAAAATRSAGCTTSRRPRAGSSRTTRRSPAISATSINRYQGVDASANFRLAGGTFINTGFNMQQRLLDDCAANRIDSPEAQFCRQLTPFRPDFKISASHTLPWALQVSGLFQLSPGPQITATWNAPNSRDCPGARPQPRRRRHGDQGDRAHRARHELQREPHAARPRLSRRFTFGRFRIRGDAALYNVFNTDWVSSVNTTFSTAASNAFMRPTGVLQGRLFKIGLQLEY